MIGIFFQSMFVGLSGAMAPGPLFAFTVTQALVGGWTAGFWLIVGHMLAEGVLLLLLRAGLGGVLQRPAATRVIGLVGGLVLLYFAWGMIAVIFTGAAAAGTMPHAGAPLHAFRLIGQGVLLTVTSPYWLLWWATVGVGLISAQHRAHGARAWPVFFVGHQLSDYLWYLAVSVTVAVTGAFLGPAAHRGLIFVSGLGVAALGLVFIYRQLRDWRRACAQISPSGIDKP